MDRNERETCSQGQLSKMEFSLLWRVSLSLPVEAIGREGKLPQFNIDDKEKKRENTSEGFPLTSCCGFGKGSEGKSPQ